MKEKNIPKYFGAGILLVLSLVLTSCGKNQNTVSARPAILVATQEVVTGDLSSTIACSGQVDGWQEADVAPAISGQVESINVHVGDRVSAQEVLCTLEQKSLALQLDSAQAGLQAALAGESAAENALNNDAQQLARYKELYTSGAISAQAYQNYQFQYQQAQAGLLSAQAQVAQARAGVSLASYNMEHSSVLSPIDGVVSARYIDLGEMAEPGIKAFSVVDLSRVKVVVTVGENYINGIKKGDAVTVSVPAAGNKTWPGTVFSISPQADPVTKGYQVEVMVKNTNMQLKAGMYARVLFTVFHVQNVLVVPVDALVQTADGEKVFVVRNNRAHAVAVTAGVSSGNRVQVSGDLQPGDRVVVEGKNGLSDGSVVKVTAGISANNGVAGTLPGQGE